jgi:hypothetical protein
MERKWLLCCERKFDEETVCSPLSLPQITRLNISEDRHICWVQYKLGMFSDQGYASVHLILRLFLMAETFFSRTCFCSLL